jgi:predicted phosphodiesterase
MKIFALSAIHIDYKENRKWLMNLSAQEYLNDVLLLAGDISDVTQLLELAFLELKKRFRMVLFVPGNHDLWTYRNNNGNSLAHFDFIKNLAHHHGILMGPVDIGPISIVPLYGWYDYSFGDPGDELISIWRDYFACTWPENFNERVITRHFTAMNEQFLEAANQHIISFSHFMPRIDLMPPFIPPERRILYPVLGTSLLEEQIRRLGSAIHIYGHTHVNRKVLKDGVLYINNAFGYPDETRITRKELLCVYET